MDNLDAKFIREVGRIKEPEVFLGVVRILGVKLVGVGEDGKGRIKDCAELLEEVFDAYSRAGRIRRKELLKILKEANKAKEEK